MNGRIRYCLPFLSAPPGVDTVVRQKGPELSRLPFQVLGGPQPRVPNPDIAARMVRIQSMPSSKLLQALNAFEGSLGAVDTAYRGCLARKPDGLRHCRVTPLDVGVRCRHLRIETLDW